MNNKVVIVGSGMMGAGIGACSAASGMNTVIVDINRERTEKGLKALRENLRQLKDGELISEDCEKKASGLVSADQDLESAVKGCGLVIEAVSEDLALKQKIFQQLDDIVPPDVYLTSNTSGLRISDIAKYMRYPERAVTTHFWFPGHLVLLVEVVMGEKTSESTGKVLCDILRSWGKMPVLVKKDLPGQLANRILQAIIREAVYIVESGIASAEDVDTAVKAGMALRFPVWGPLEHIDGVGLDLACSVQKTVLPSLDSKTVPGTLLEELIENKNLGYKTGTGIYDWTEKDMNALAEKRDKFIMNAVKIVRELEKPV